MLLTVLFRFLAGLVIWIVMIALVAGSLAGTGFLWWAWYSNTSLGTYADTKEALLAYAILASIVTVISQHRFHFKKSTDVDFFGRFSFCSLSL